MRLSFNRSRGRPVQLEVTGDVKASLLAWLERRGGTVEDYAFPSRVNHAHHISTGQYARLVDGWVAADGLRAEEYGTHSLRRTKASMIYKACAPFSSFLGVPRSRMLSDISASMWRMRCYRPSELKSDVWRPSDTTRMPASAHGISWPVGLGVGSESPLFAFPRRNLTFRSRPRTRRGKSFPNINSAIGRQRLDRGGKATVCFRAAFYKCGLCCPDNVGAESCWSAIVMCSAKEEIAVSMHRRLI